MHAGASLPSSHGQQIPHVSSASTLLASSLTRKFCTRLQSVAKSAGALHNPSSPCSHPTGQPRYKRRQSGQRLVVEEEAVERAALGCTCALCAACCKNFCLDLLCTSSATPSRSDGLSFDEVNKGDAQAAGSSADDHAGAETKNKQTDKARDMRTTTKQTPFEVQIQPTQK